MNKEKVKSLLVLIFGVVVILLLFINNDLRYQNNYIQKTIDQRFAYYFSALCGELDPVEGGAGAKRAYGNICWDLFVHTSYADNKDLESLVLQICQWGKLGELDEHLDNNLQENLGQLCQRLGSYGQGRWNRDRDQDTERLIKKNNELIEIQESK